MACPANTAASDFILDQANVDFDKTQIYGTKTLTTTDDLKNVSTVCMPCQTGMRRRRRRRRRCGVISKLILLHVGLLIHR